MTASVSAQIYLSFKRATVSYRNFFHLLRAEFLFLDLKVGSWLSQLGQTRRKLSLEELLASPSIWSNTKLIVAPFHSLVILHIAHLLFCEDNI